MGKARTYLARLEARERRENRMLAVGALYLLALGLVCVLEGSVTMLWGWSGYAAYGALEGYRCLRRRRRRSASTRPLADVFD